MADSAFSLSSLPRRRTARHYRRGRGNARRGSYSGRGIKGQRARTGGRQGIRKRSLKHLIHRVPKIRGFKSFRPTFATITIMQLEQYSKQLPATITPSLLREKRLLDRVHAGVRIVGSGTLSKAIRISAHGFSKNAEAAILKAGGTPVLLNRTTKPKSKPKKAESKA